MPEPNPGYRYFRGYPERYRRAYRRRIGCLLGCLPFVAVPVFTWAFYFQSLQQTFRLSHAAGLLVSFLMFVYLALMLVLERHSVTLVPYFESRLGDAATFGLGADVARNCELLDGLASRAGLAPLSAFGFNDDLDGEELRWHAAADGLVTVRGLLRLLEDHPGLVPRQDEVRNELLNIQDALAKAAAKGVRFCFHLRVWNATNAQEHAIRKGSYF